MILYFKNKYIILTEKTVALDNYNFIEENLFLQCSISTVDFILIGITLLFLRFFCWRVFVFSYVFYIWVQCRIIRNLLCPTVELPYTSYIEKILADLILPYGDKIRKTLVLYSGGGFVLSSSEVKGRFLQDSTYKSNFTDAYADAISRNDFTRCINLMKDASLTEGRYVLKLTNRFLNSKARNEYQSSKNIKFFADAFNDFSAVQFKQLLKKSEEQNNVSYLIGDKKFYDLNSLDSSQNESTLVFNKAFARNYKKSDELVDVASFSKQQENSLTYVCSVAEKGQRNDFYTFLALKKLNPKVRAYITENSQFEYNYLKEILKTLVIDSQILSHDVMRKSIKTSSLFEVSESITREKVYPLLRALDNGVSFDQHVLDIVLTGRRDTEFSKELEIILNKKLLTYSIFKDKRIAVNVETTIDPLEYLSN